MPLSLTARKSLRDNEESLKENTEKLKEILGIDWTFEFDFETILTKCTDDYVQRSPGEIFYKNVAEGVVCCVKDACKSEICKEALIEANSENKVIVRVNEDKKNTDYWKYIFENNTLVLLFRSPMSNIGDCSYFKLANIIPSPGVFSLVARLNLKENEEKFTEAFERINNVTKESWSYDESSLEEIYPKLDYNKERIGDCFADILSNIADNICKRCQDDMTLEAFNEATPNHKIIFRHNAKQSDYWLWAFVAGDLVVSFRSISNTSDNSYFNFEKLL
eukprot:gene6582-7639_t